MLRFLSSLFASPEEPRPDGLDEALVEKATERLLEGTDPRIRALSDYRERLSEPVVQAILHVIALVDALPPPVAISPQAFGEDGGLRAFFVSTEHLREVLGGFNTVREYLENLAGPPPEDIFGLLTMLRQERNVFGMELDGDTLRRDVLQVAVNFSSHRYHGIACTEADTRRELKKMAFDFLVQTTLQRLTDERSKRRELDRQRHLLRQKLDAMQAGQWGMNAMLGEGGGQEAPDLAQLEAEIEAIDAELGQAHADKLSLEDSLECIADTLNRPADWLASREISLRLDYRGVKIDDTAAAAGREITLTELFSSTGEHRTVLLGRIARADLPEPPDFWKVAKRYL